MKNLAVLIALLGSSFVIAQVPYSLSFNGSNSYVLSSDVEGNKVALVNSVTSLNFMETSYVVSMVEDGVPKWGKDLLIDSLYPTSLQLAIDPVTTDIVVYYTILNEFGTSVVVSKLAASTGDLMWSKRVAIPIASDGSGGFYESIKNISISPDQTIHIALSLLDHLRYIEMSGNGELLLSKKINNLGDDPGKNPGFCMNQCANGSFLVSLKEDSWPTIAVLNPDLTVAWSQKWSFETYSHPKVIQQLSNGKIVVAGFGDNGLFVALLNANGEFEKYLRSEQTEYMHGATSVFELDQNRLLLGTGYNIYLVVDLATDQWKSYSLAHNIRFDKTDQGICAWIENNLVGGVVQLIPSFQPENQECIIIDEVNEGTLINIPTENYVQNAVPFYFKNNGSISDASMELTDYTVTNGMSCILEAAELTEISMELYPNPVSNGEWISLEINQSVQNGFLELTDLSGKKLSKQPMNGKQSVFKVSELAAGMYLIQLTDSTGKLLTAKRIVVK